MTRWLNLLALGVVVFMDQPAGRAAMTATLSVEERVAAQEAIERIYYSYQVDATKPFEEAVPRKLIERKVRDFLRQSDALSKYWQTEITEQMLREELRRIEINTRLPRRLQQIQQALGNDPVLIRECLVRPAIVDRLSRNFFSGDGRIHAAQRRLAQGLHDELSLGRIDALEEHPRRTVVEFEIESHDGRLGGASPGPRESLRVSPEELEQLRSRGPRRRGEVGALQEERDAFVIPILLKDDGDRLRLATYVVPKITWDEWWQDVSGQLDDTAVAAVAREHVIPESEASPDRQDFDSGGEFDPESVECGMEDRWTPVPGSSVPQVRSNHSAVWTGTHMIIWGGATSSSILRTGGRYDPLLDTWMSVSQVGAPVARYRHLAVWAGSSMVIWGGYMNFGGGVTLSGGRYDPATDTWLPISTVNSPNVVEGTALWTGSRVLVWGGPGPGARYDPVDDQWYPITTSLMPEPYISSPAVWTGSLMIVWRDSGRRYDPVSDTWSPVALTGAPNTGAFPSVVWTGNRMLVWGGAGAGGVLNTGGLYDPQTNTWTATSTVGAPPRRSALTVWTGTEMIVYQGFNDMGGTNSGARYNPTLNSWVPMSVSNSPSFRSSATSVWTGNLMVVWGGFSGVHLNTGGRYNPATDSWTPTSTWVLEPRQKHKAVWTGSLMLVWGGTGFPAPQYGARFDPLLSAWAPISSLNAPNGGDRMSVVWTGTRMIVWGGTTGRLYEPFANTWTPMATQNAPAERLDHLGVWSGTEMLVWGGTGAGSIPVNTGGRYDPETDEWSEITTIGAPPSLQGASAVWDGSGMLVWGGRITDFMNEGYRYFPSTDSWTPISTLDAPVGRWNHTAVWTGEEVLIWGGSNYSGLLNTGGRYDPSTDTWRSMSLSHAPFGRSGQSGTWTGQVMVIWGGRAGSVTNTGGRYNPVSDTWVATTQTGAPSTRENHTAVWADGSLIVWGGVIFGEVSDGASYTPDQSSDSDGDEVTVCQGDCDDSRASVYYNAPQICGDDLNNDCLHPSFPLLSGTNEVDDDSDSFSECTGDCDDVDEAVFPGAVEICNTQDDDCDGVINEGFENDGDGYATCLGDCDDTRGTVYPGAPQICDGLNNDCNSPVWPGLSGGNDGDDDADTLSECQGDCDDFHGSVYPGAPHICDGLNNDCNAPGWPIVGFNESDDDFDSFSECQGDCDDTQWLVYPGAFQFCGDGLNNNCADPSWPVPPAGEMDVDSDGFPQCNDCNDHENRVHPQGSQLCDGLNNNCAHPSWPGLADTNEADNDGDSYSGCQGDCADADTNTHPLAPEVNDGRDNQCPAEQGHGIADEVSGFAGFHAPQGNTGFCWTAQAGAALYAPLRANNPLFSTACVVAPNTSATCWNDPTTPALGSAFFYLVRPIAPRVGSWGQYSNGVERLIGCDVPICGNGVKDGSEVCDGQDLGGESCISLGFESGILACKSTCNAFNTTGCLF